MNSSSPPQADKPGAILFYDVETTGKADFKKAEDAPHQPRIVSIAALLTDAEGEEISKAHLIVKPDGFAIPLEVTRDVHGISHDLAAKRGIPIKTALSVFGHLAFAADLLVAYNDKFDRFLITGESKRLNLGTPFIMRKTMCMMMPMVELCQLPNPNDWSTDPYKWPKLEEAYYHCFQSRPEKSHDAMADVITMLKIYFWYRDKTVASPPPSPLTSPQQSK